MKLFGLGLTVAASTLALVGCMDESVYMDPQANAVGVAGGGMPSNITLQDAFMKGDIGPVVGLNGAAQVDGYDDPQLGTSTVNVTSQAPNGSGLVILSLDRSLKSLPAGVTHMTGSNDLSSNSYVQLCSDTAGGQSVHFDGIAEDVTINVTDRDAAHRDVDITAKISQGFDGPAQAPTTVNSHFTLLK